MAAELRDAPFDLDAVRAALQAEAVGEDAVHMAAYMKDQFPFLGVKAGARRIAAKPSINAAATADPTELLVFVDDCWDEPEREFQNLAVDCLRKGVRNLAGHDLTAIERLIRTKSWWDTVDGLAAWVVGPIVRQDPRAIAVVDGWAESTEPEADLWVIRAAIIHQLGFKEHTDTDRLFTWCDRWAEHPDFFIRKGIGWALRQHARQDPDAVRSFVAAHDHRLSGLSKREATKHL